MQRPVAQQKVSGFNQVSSGIYAAPVLSREICDRVVAAIPALAWQQAHITTYERTESRQITLVKKLDTERRSCSRVYLSDLQLADHPHIAAYLDIVSNSVFPLIRKEFSLNVDTFGEAEIVRYPDGGLFIPHLDSNKLKSYRAFTVILYLNDNFRGGETTFPDQNFSFRPKAGDVLIFPSHLLHGGETVSGGEKYIIVLWVFFPD